MKALALLFAAVSVVSLAAQAGRSTTARTGSINGHVRLAGKLPGNSVIRMGVDPKCAAMNDGKRVVQEIVAAAADGSLANVFVSLQGTFASTPVPSAPVLVDQQACVYRPRVVGVRVGQVLEFRNSDALLHDVHSTSTHGNEFNVGQPITGMVYRYTPQHEDLMLHLKCDIHSWMTAYIGVVAHPYFAVSGEGGTFEIVNVPPGTHSIQAWHEKYGATTQKVTVRAGQATAVNFEYKAQ